MNKSWFCSSHGIRMNTKCQKLGFRQTVVTNFHLMKKHSTVLIPDSVEFIFFVWDGNTSAKIFCICCHVHKTQFKMNGTIKEIKECTPLLKDLYFILLLSQLIVNVLKLNGFCVIILTHSADSILKHSIKRN